MEIIKLHQAKFALRAIQHPLKTYQHRQGPLGVQPNRYMRGQARATENHHDWLKSRMYACCMARAILIQRQVGSNCARRSARRLARCLMASLHKTQMTRTWWSITASIAAHPLTLRKVQSSTKPMTPSHANLMKP